MAAVPAMMVGGRPGVGGRGLPGRCERQPGNPHEECGPEAGVLGGCLAGGPARQVGGASAVSLVGAVAALLRRLDAGWRPTSFGPHALGDDAEVRAALVVTTLLGLLTEAAGPATPAEARLDARLEEARALLGLVDVEDVPVVVPLEGDAALTLVEYAARHGLTVAGAAAELLGDRLEELAAPLRG